jgi:hypothetical protein
MHCIYVICVMLYIGHTHIIDTHALRARRSAPFLLVFFCFVSYLWYRDSQVGAPPRRLARGSRPTMEGNGKVDPKEAEGVNEGPMGLPCWGF